MSKNLKEELLAQTKAKKLKTLIAVRLPNDLHKEIMRLSKLTGASKSDVIVMALRKGLNIEV